MKRVMHYTFLYGGSWIFGMMTVHPLEIAFAMKLILALLAGAAWGWFYYAVLQRKLLPGWSEWE